MAWGEKGPAKGSGSGTAFSVHGARHGKVVYGGLLLAAVAGMLLLAVRQACWAEQGGSLKQGQSQEKGTDRTVESASLGRGTKLILKDGTFQLVRSYQRIGDRVRYLSAERGEWEELPASLVDWEATAKAEAEAKKQSKDMTDALHRQEAEKAQMPMDVGASLEVMPGLFLPDGEGLYVMEGRSVRLLDQVDTRTKLSKGRTLAQVFVPVHVVPTEHRVEVPGARAKLRLTTTQPEFYLREAPSDPDRVSPVQKSSRPGESGPDLELIEAKVKGGNRQLEWIETNPLGENYSKQNSISIQRWQIAPNVFRFTLSEALKPGEFALAELLPEGMNLYVWDFGVDPGTPPAEKKPAPGPVPPQGR